MNTKLNTFSSPLSKTVSYVIEYCLSSLSDTLGWQSLKNLEISSVGTECGKWEDHFREQVGII